MTKYIVGIFKDVEHADEAASELMELGFTADLSIAFSLQNHQANMFDHQLSQGESMITVTVDIDDIPEVQKVLRDHAAYEVFAPLQHVVA